MLPRSSCLSPRSAGVVSRPHVCESGCGIERLTPRAEVVDGGADIRRPASDIRAVMHPMHHGVRHLKNPAIARQQTGLHYLRYGFKVRDTESHARPFYGVQGRKALGNRSRDRIRLSGKSAWLFFNPPGDTVSPEDGVVTPGYDQEIIMKLQRIVIEAFVDEGGTIQQGRITYPDCIAPVEETPSTPSPSGGVKLDPKSPDFETKKRTLKEKGYKYDRNTQSWQPPANGTAIDSSPQQSSVKPDWFGDATEISLNRADPDFEAKKAALKAAGFNWRRDRKVWVKSQ